MEKALTRSDERVCRGRSPILILFAYPLLESDLFLSRPASRTIRLSVTQLFLCVLWVEPRSGDETRGGKKGVQ